LLASVTRFARTVLELLIAVFEVQPVYPIQR
jgi:hypothetical protein